MAFLLELQIDTNCIHYAGTFCWKMYILFLELTTDFSWTAIYLGSEIDSFERIWRYLTLYSHWSEIWHSNLNSSKSIRNDYSIAWHSKDHSLIAKLCFPIISRNGNTTWSKKANALKCYLRTLLVFMERIYSESC